MGWLNIWSIILFFFFHYVKIDDEFVSCLYFAACCIVTTISLACSSLTYFNLSNICNTKHFEVFHKIQLPKVYDWYVTFKMLANKVLLMLSFSFTRGNGMYVAFPDSTDRKMGLHNVFYLFENHNDLVFRRIILK